MHVKCGKWETGTGQPCLSLSLEPGQAQETSWRAVLSVITPSQGPIHMSNGHDFQGVGLGGACAEMPAPTLRLLISSQGNCVPTLPPTPLPQPQGRTSDLRPGRATIIPPPDAPAL